MHLIECKSETFDLDTDEGAYGYLAKFLKEHAANTNVFSCVARLYNVEAKKEHIIKSRQRILKLEEDKRSLRQAVRLALDELQQSVITNNCEHTDLVVKLCRKTLQNT